jgi:hemerythrin-like metal-binding protein
VFDGAHTKRRRILSSQHKRIMPVFTWGPQYEIGHAEIDTDHRLLVETINRLFAAIHQSESLVIYDQLGVIHQYVANHFTREETLMEQIGYPDRDRHRALHAAFTRRYMAFVDRDPKVLLVKVSVWLHDWLYAHILVEDRKIFEYVSSLPPTAG